MLEQRPYTPKELATRWQCSERHVRKLVQKGELPCFRLGNLIRVTPEDVEQYECGSNSIEQGTTPSGQRMGKPAASRSAPTILTLPNSGLRTSNGNP
ncbi:MAG: helix-turn-helix domain-containing protein [Alphaproteobacteria bacterium]|nr:helix-turn-helix domain-containing protein [Alphaproteobacteria bacterium]